jgi:hypothetical protein
MAWGGFGLSSIGAAGVGAEQGYDNGLKTQQDLMKLIQAKNVLAGDQAYGKSLPGMFNQQVPGSQPMPQMQQGGGMPPQGGGQPPMGPQAQRPPMAPMQQPGQPQMRAPPQMMPQGGGQPPMQGGGGMQPGGQQQGGMQAPQGQQQQPAGPLTWQQIVQTVQRNNPGIKPEALGAAVDRYMPMMNQQSQMEWKQVMMQQRQQMETGRNDRFQQGEQDKSQRQAVTQGGQNQRQQVAEGGRDARAGAKEKGIQGRFDARQDKAVQQLAMQRQKLEQQIAATKDRSQLGQWRALLDAEHKKATEVIQAYSVNNNMPDGEKKKMLTDQMAFYNDAIDKMRAQMGSSTQTGGTSDKGGPKQPDRMESKTYTYDPGSGALQPTQ